MTTRTPSSGGGQADSYSTAMVNQCDRSDVRGVSDTPCPGRTLDGGILGVNGRRSPLDLRSGCVRTGTCEEKGALGLSATVLPGRTTDSDPVTRRFYLEAAKAAGGAARVPRRGSPHGLALPRAHRPDGEHPNRDRPPWAGRCSCRVSGPPRPRLADGETLDFSHGRMSKPGASSMTGSADSTLLHKRHTADRPVPTSVGVPPPTGPWDVRKGPRSARPCNLRGPL